MGVWDELYILASLKLADLVYTFCPKGCGQAWVFNYSRFALSLAGFMSLTQGYYRYEPFGAAAASLQASKLPGAEAAAGAGRDTSSTSSRACWYTWAKGGAWVHHTS